MLSLTTQSVLNLLNLNQQNELLNALISDCWVVLYIRYLDPPVIVGIYTTSADAIDGCLENIGEKIGWGERNGEKIYSLTDGEYYITITKDDVLESLSSKHHFEDMIGNRWFISKFINKSHA